MKIESRFLIVITSLLLGSLGGWLYFEIGDLFYCNRVEKCSEDASSTFFAEGKSEISHKSDSSEIISQMRSTVNETLYQHTAHLEAEKAKKTVDLSGQKEAQTLVAQKDSTSRNVLREMADTSAPLAESLTVLAELSHHPVSATRTTISGEQVAVSNTQPAQTQALFHVKDFERKAAGKTPSLELSIADSTSHNHSEEPVYFRTETPLEAQQALSAELVSQLPPLPGQPIYGSEDQLEPAVVNQALGSRMELPSDSTGLPVVNPLPAENSTTNTANPAGASIPALVADSAKNSPASTEDLDVNPLATIMGLQTEKKETREEIPQSVPLIKPQPEIPVPHAQEITEEEAPKSQPTRMKKPSRTSETEGKIASEVVENEKPAKEFKLDLYRVDLRKALASFQLETGLKVVASLDVQGTVSCRSKNYDPEVLLDSLLADTSFRFVRSGNFVYIAHSDRMENLPTPLEKMDTEVFIPKNISVEELELIFRSNLSQFGKCERKRNDSGQEGLSVTDWVLTLEQLEDIQQVVDLPAPENRINAFVFQHEVDGTFKALELVSIAEERGLVLQRMTIPNLNSQEDKKSTFTGGFGMKTKEHKENSKDIKVYSISYRADSLLVSIKDQLGTHPAQIVGPTSAPMQLNQPRNFDFNLNVQDQIVPYRFTITFRQENTSGHEGEGEILADVVCEPREDLGSKAKPKPIQFTLPMPTNSENSLVFQFNLGGFPVENSGKRKNPAYAFHGNRMTKEAIVVICPYQQAAKLPRTGLSTQAIREIIRQQEVFGRKFYGSLDRDEREKSTVCFEIAKRLRYGLGETAEQPQH